MSVGPFLHTHADYSHSLLVFFQVFRPHAEDQDLEEKLQEEIKGRFGRKLTIQVKKPKLTNVAFALTLITT